MDSTNQGFPLGGNPSPFSSWRDVGALHMATLSLPGLTIGLPVWLFSTSIVQSTMILKQSNQRLDDTRVPPQPSTSFVSPSPSYSSLGEDGKTKNQVTEKKKRGEGEEEEGANGRKGNRASSSKNPHTAPSKPKSQCVIYKGDHYHRDCP